MMRKLATWLTVGVLLAGGAAAVPSSVSSTSAATPVRLTRVIDGDTIALTNGERVRLLQIDTPEVGTGECYSRAAARDLRRLLPVGALLVLEADSRLDDRDRYARLLRYVWRGGLDVNLQLVRDGSATVWLYGGVQGKHAAQLLAAGRAARDAKRGLWGACPRTPWNPFGPATTGPGSGPGTGGAAARPSDSGSGSGSGKCDPAYPGVCIASPPPDLDCRDVPFKDFRVLPPDPHRFDREGDGRGCEG